MTKRAKKVGSRSPWGKIDHVETIAPGIQFCGTPSHGGYFLSDERNAQVHPAWRSKWASSPSLDNWYEEDCRWAIVAFHFPEFFTGAQYEASVATLKNWHPDEWEQVTGEKVKPEESHKVRERIFAAENKGKLFAIAAWGDWSRNVPKGMVGVCVTVDGERCRNHLPESPRYLLVPAELYNIPGTFVTVPGQFQEVPADPARDGCPFGV